MALNPLVRFIPLSVVILMPITFTISYTMARTAGHISGFNYISDTGTKPAESCYFGQLLNIIGLLLAYSCYYLYLLVSAQNIICSIYSTMHRPRRVSRSLLALLAVPFFHFAPLLDCEGHYPIKENGFHSAFNSFLARPWFPVKNRITCLGIFDSPLFFWGGLQLWPKTASNAWEYLIHRFLRDCASVFFFHGHHWSWAIWTQTEKLSGLSINGFCPADSIPIDYGFRIDND